jgi:hypothetical protein
LQPFDDIRQDLVATCRAFVFSEDEGAKVERSS